MSGDCEINKCSVCGKRAMVQRKVFHYDIKCQCHSPNHFEIVYHCDGCVPVEPTTTKIYVKPDGRPEVDMLFQTVTLPKIKG